MAKGKPSAARKGAASRPRRDDLPVVTSSRLRALGLIKPGAETVTFELGGVKLSARLWHMAFPNGGGWSFFLCPSCGVRARTLRLYDGRAVCRRCDGLLSICQAGRGFDLEARIARLRQRLYDGRGRSWGRATPERRAQLEISLRRALIRQRRLRLHGYDP
jgi:hypothetical protein